MRHLRLTALVCLATLSACQAGQSTIAFTSNRSALGYPRFALSMPGNTRARILHTLAAEPPGLRAEGIDGPANAGLLLYADDTSSLVVPASELARITAAVEHSMEIGRPALPSLPIARTIEIESIRSALRGDAEPAF